MGDLLMVGLLFLQMVGFFVFGVFIYRLGLKDGLKCSKSSKIEPIFASKRQEEKKDISDFENIANYDPRKV